MAKMTDTGCSQCDESIIEYGQQCPKHLLEHLKWVAEQAQKDYMDELKAQSKKQESERNQNEKLRQVQKHKIYPEK